jgi:hypothetical protein
MRPLQQKILIGFQSKNTSKDTYWREALRLQVSKLQQKIHAIEQPDRPWKDTLQQRIIDTAYTLLSHVELWTDP